MKTIPKCLTLATLAVAFSAGGTAVLAVPAFSVNSGGIVIGAQNTATAATAAGTAWTVSETMTSAGILALTDTDGNPLVSPFPTAHNSGAWVTKTVLNNTGIAWTSFELELQQIVGTPSGDGDGLSFAQGAGLAFTSSVFSTFTRIDTTRDYLNFSNGNVAPGASVSFTFAITENSPQSPIFLNQTPNRVDAPPGVPDGGSAALLLVMGLAGLLGLRRKLR